MDEFLNYLIKKSDIENNEYYNYRRPMERPRRVPGKTGDVKYPKIEEPTVNDYVVLDFETTGLNCRVNRIIEIGSVKVKNGVICDKFSTLIDPEQFIPSYISTKVHITNTMVQNKPKIEEVLPKFAVFAEGLPIVAHNAPFDMSFLLENASNCGITIENPVIDTLCLSRRYNKECSKHNLGYLADFFGIDLKNAHRALFDAMATQKLYEMIKEKYNNIRNEGNL